MAPYEYSSRKHMESLPSFVQTDVERKAQESINAKTNTILPIGTKVRIKNTFDRNGEIGMPTRTPDFEAVIVEQGDITESYTGHQSYIVELTGIVPPEVGVRRWWADATQFDVIED